MARSTRQREAIRDALQAAGRPLSPEEIHHAASRDVESLGMATVYRTIKHLLDEHAIAPVELPGEPPRYELKEAADQHHHHFRCDHCGRVFDLHGCVQGLDALLPKGFTLTGHDITLTGLCERCSA